MIGFLPFGLFAVIFFFLPGFFLLEWAEIKIPRIMMISLAFLTGISLFVFLSFAIRFARLPFQVLLIYAIGVITVSYLKRKILFSFFTLKNWNLFPSIFTLSLIFFVLSLTVGHITSGFVNGELHLSAARDSFWRVAISEELTKNFPPQIPGFPPILLKNYHFFYDLLIAATSVLTGISVVSLYFKYFTILCAFVLVVTLYSFISFFANSKWFSLLGTFLAVTTGNLSYLLRFISDQHTFVARSNIFMSDQPFDQSHNPFNLLAYALFIGILLSFSLWEKQKTGKLFVLISLLVAVLPGIKIYGGMLIFCGLLVLISYEILLRRSFYFYFLAPFILAIPFFLAIKGKSFSILAFNPGWLLIKMTEDHDRLFLTDMMLKEQYYRETGNSIRLVYLKFVQLGIYLVGNLNIRLIALLLFLKRFRNKLFSSPIQIIFLSVVFVSFALPLLFSQNRSPYDSIQFTPYGLLLMSCLSIPVIEKIAVVLVKRFSTLGVAIFVIMLIVLAIPTNLVILQGRLNDPKEKIEKEEVDGLIFLQKESPQNAVILSDTDEEKLVYMYIPALSSRKTFLSGVALTEQLGIEVKTRKEHVEDFFKYDPLVDSGKIPEKRDFLYQNSISYIYLSKSGLRNQLLAKDLGFSPIFTNEKVIIYKIP